MQKAVTLHTSGKRNIKEMTEPHRKTKHLHTMKKEPIILTAMLSVLTWTACPAQQVLTLQQCRDSALANNRELEMAGQKITVAEYDRKIARANYFPDISVSAAYMYNSRNLSLLSENASDLLANIGTEITDRSELLRIIGRLTSADIEGSLNEIGSEINRAFGLDIQNVYIGAVSLKQPVFMGGKIVAANRMATLAGELAESQHETVRNTVTNEVDNAYWQTVSIAGKKRLAQDYADLLHQMLHDTELLEAEGMATQADLLAVRVKANEADMLLTKAANGLVLSKMLLCKLCGMNPDSDIELADENADRIPLPGPEPMRSDEEIFASRPEIRSLELAREIYGRKVAVARADMMPEIAVTANYFVTNPNLYHGFRNDFSGMFNVGVAVHIPIIHGCEAMYKVRKAKAETVIADCQIADAREKISLQVTQLRKQKEEALEKLEMAENNLGSAEENLRTATLGYNEGVIPSGTALAAQTAWMKAHSEYIDAGVELKMAESALFAAEGRHGTAQNNNVNLMK